MKKNFIRKIEKFECDQCGEKVEGTGYTNHCPKCLMSLHVDENVPGDRLSECKGAMNPIEIDKKGGIFVIIHKCERCGKATRNRVSERDNYDKIVEISVSVKK